ncbi:hypothetical protein [Rhodococcus sp. IEGM 1379]|nr:hypothetical protein [Rhodococcus sp. IEGM 1379]MDI9917508.1 hypothetical protein [Rhodococcus sp. IEGM 1379]
MSEQKMLKETAAVVHTRRRTVLPRVVITEQAYRLPPTTRINRKDGRR